MLQNMTNDQFLNLKGRYKRNIYQKNQKALCSDSMKEQLLSGKNIWDIPFYFDSHAQDDDSSSSDEDELGDLDANGNPEESKSGEKA
jgi:hypothetical protein